MIVLLKDLRGYRLGNAVDEGAEFFKLDSGETVGKSKCWPAIPSNIELALADMRTIGRSTVKLKQLDQGFQMDLDPAEIVVLLRHSGGDLDEDLRFRKKMLPPFTEIGEDDIMPIIASHLENCEQDKKDPENVPIEMAFIQGHIVFRAGDKLATGQHKGGRISLFNNKQVILSFNDWHYVPKSSTRGVLVHFLKCEPTDATSIKELCGKDKFLADDGVLCNSGVKKLVQAGQRTDFKDELEAGSVDDLIKGIEL